MRVHGVGAAAEVDVVGEVEARLLGKLAARQGEAGNKRR